MIFNGLVIFLWFASIIKKLLAKRLPWTIFLLSISSHYIKCFVVCYLFDALRDYPCLSPSVIPSIIYPCPFLCSWALCLLGSIFPWHIVLFFFFLQWLCVRTGSPRFLTCPVSPENNLVVQINVYFHCFPHTLFQNKLSNDSNLSLVHPERIELCPRRALPPNLIWN